MVPSPSLFGGMNRFVVPFLSLMYTSMLPVVFSSKQQPKHTCLRSFRWEVRESCSPLALSEGYLYKYDVSLPVSTFDSFIDEMRAHLASTHPHAEAVNWGHVIDGNLHLNIVTPGVHQEDPSLLSRIEPYVFEAVTKRGGSISAEHGLGQCKNEYLPMIKNPVALQMMQALKRQFDPNGILNPGKYLPTERTD